MGKFFLLLFFLVTSISCHSDGDEIYFLLSREELILNSSGDVQTVTIETNDEWRVISDIPSWLTIDYVKNDVINSLVIKAEVNTEETERSTKIVFETSNSTSELSIRQKGKDFLAFESDGICRIGAADTLLDLRIRQTVLFDLIIPDTVKSWIEVNRDVVSFNRIQLKVSANHASEARCGQVLLQSKDYSLSDTLLIVQDGSADWDLSYVDGSYIQVQKSSKGNVNLVVMGDGFIEQELVSNDYESYMVQAVEYFFSVEPYSYYRDFFNVYIVFAESEEAGVSEKGSLRSVHNKFDSAFGSGTEITCNADLVFEYARKVKELPVDQPITVIVVLNSTKYAGTTYLYADGNSIALCPMSAEESPNDFEGLIHHEAGGHGFGFLCDEYVYYEKEMPDSRKENLREWQKLGFQMNLDFTDDLSEILWKDFIGIGKYADVGAYEGGYEYRYGAWRSEQNSCMNNNVPYFNVQSRWSIVRRIMQLSGCDFSIWDFIEKDFPVYPSEIRTRSETDFVPLGNPIWIR